MNMKPTTLSDHELDSKQVQHRDNVSKDFTDLISGLDMDIPKRGNENNHNSLFKNESECLFSKVSRGNDAFADKSKHSASHEKPVSTSIRINVLRDIDMDSLANEKSIDNDFYNSLYDLSSEKYNSIKSKELLETLLLNDSIFNSDNIKANKFLYPLSNLVVKSLKNEPLYQNIYFNSCETICEKCHSHKLELVCCEKCKRIECHKCSGVNFNKYGTTILQYAKDYLKNYPNISSEYFSDIIDKYIENHFTGLQIEDKKEMKKVCTNFYSSIHHEQKVKTKTKIKQQRKDFQVLYENWKDKKEKIYLENKEIDKKFLNKKDINYNIRPIETDEKSINKTIKKDKFIDYSNFSDVEIIKIPENNDEKGNSSSSFITVNTVTDTIVFNGTIFPILACRQCSGRMLPYHYIFFEDNSLSLPREFLDTLELEIKYKSTIEGFVENEVDFRLVILLFHILNIPLLKSNNLIKILEKFSFCSQLKFNDYQKSYSNKDSLKHTLTNNKSNHIYIDRNTIIAFHLIFGYISMIPFINTNEIYSGIIASKYSRYGSPTLYNFCFVALFYYINCYVKQSYVYIHHPFRFCINRTYTKLMGIAPHRIIESVISCIYSLLIASPFTKDNKSRQTDIRDLLVDYLTDINKNISNYYKQYDVKTFIPLLCYIKLPKLLGGYILSYGYCETTSGRYTNYIDMSLKRPQQSLIFNPFNYSCLVPAYENNIKIQGILNEETVHTSVVPTSNWMAVNTIINIDEVNMVNYNHYQYSSPGQDVPQINNLRTKNWFFTPDFTASPDIYKINQTWRTIISQDKSILLEGNILKGNRNKTSIDLNYIRTLIGNALEIKEFNHKSDFRYIFNFVKLISNCMPHNIRPHYINSMYGKAYTFDLAMNIQENRPEENLENRVPVHDTFSAFDRHCAWTTADYYFENRELFHAKWRDCIVLVRTSHTDIDLPIAAIIQSRTFGLGFTSMSILRYGSELANRLDEAVQWRGGDAFCGSTFAPAINHWVSMDCVSHINNDFVTKPPVLFVFYDEKFEAYPIGARNISIGLGLMNHISQWTVGNINDDPFIQVNWAQNQFNLMNPILRSTLGQIYDRALNHLTEIKVTDFSFLEYCIKMAFITFPQHTTRSINGLDIQNFEVAEEYSWREQEYANNLLSYDWNLHPTPERDDQVYENARSATLVPSLCLFNNVGVTSESNSVNPINNLIVPDEYVICRLYHVLGMYDDFIIDSHSEKVLKSIPNITAFNEIYCKNGIESYYSLAFYKENFSGQDLTEFTSLQNADACRQASLYRRKLFSGLYSYEIDRGLKYDDCGRMQFGNFNVGNMFNYDIVCPSTYQLMTDRHDERNFRTLALHPYLISTRTHILTNFYNDRPDCDYRFSSIEKDFRDFQIDETNFEKMLRNQHTNANVWVGVPRKLRASNQNRLFTYLLNVINSENKRKLFEQYFAGWYHNGLSYCPVSDTDQILQSPLVNMWYPRAGDFNYTLIHKQNDLRNYLMNTRLIASTDFCNKILAYVKTGVTCKVEVAQGLLVASIGVDNADQTINMMITPKNSIYPNGKKISLFKYLGDRMPLYYDNKIIGLDVNLGGDFLLQEIALPKNKEKKKEEQKIDLLPEDK